MFGRRFPLVTLLGFEIRFDLTWIILVALIVWALTVGYFPAAYADLPLSTYVWMGILGAGGLFISLVLHELAHSVVGRRMGMEIHGITLFAFGGAAELRDEPPTPRAEALMALAGPAASVVLAAAFYLSAAWAAQAAVPGPLLAVLGYLAAINLVLAVFNMLPAFPLDGGRVLRSAIWAWTGDVVRATRIASLCGGGLGLGLIALGILQLIGGAPLAGAWWFVIGLFIRAAAAAAYQRLQVRRVLEDVPVERLMTRQPAAVPPHMTADRLVEDYLLGRSLKSVPVVEDGRLLGLVGVDEVKSVPVAERSRRPVAELLVPTKEDLLIPPTMEAAEALERMRENGRSRLYVVDNDTLVGVVSLRDLLQYLGVAVELHEPRPERGQPSRERGHAFPAGRPHHQAR